MRSVEEILEQIREQEINTVDFRFSDIRGTWHHIGYHRSQIDADLLEEGVMFDGSSIAGWKSINDSDMLLKPDLTRVVRDPFSALGQLVVFCDVVEPSTGQPYERDPRSIAKRAETWLRASGIADQAFFGPEPEFFVFDDVRWQVSMHEMAFRMEFEESPSETNRRRDEGNMGHRPGVKGGYLPVGPADSGSDLRAEMLEMMHEMGVPVEKHHHEVAPGQHELGFKFSALTESADNLQIYKYCVRNVAHSYGKTATFMPKPVVGDNGSGMHVHQSLWKGDQALFSGNQYADLSETALWYIGGIIRHARALNALTNSTTNSYKRLVPGFEAPVLLAYSARNRSASCRIPQTDNPKAKRIEARFPDAAGNPYLTFAALLMAGLDGIRQRIHPGEAMDKNLYDLPPEELKGIPTVCRSLQESLEALSADRDFLKAGDVFSDGLIDALIELKTEEVLRLDTSTHPVEFDLYYGV